MRNICKQQANACYSNYINEIQLKLSDNPKLFWKFIRDKNKETGIPKTMKYNDMCSSDGKLIVNMFAQHFSSAYGVSTDPGNNVLKVINSNLNLSSLHLTITEVLDKLNDIDIKKGSGPDKIHPIFLKNCAFALSRPFWLLFNYSLETGIFPHVWKLGHVTPVYKNNGDKDLVKNYRPITKISVIPKIFESLVNDHLMRAFRNTIISNQHGFCENRSVSTNLIVCHDYLVDALDRFFRGV